MIDPAEVTGSGRQLLAAARAAQDAQDAEHTRLLIIAARWADEHPADDGRAAEHDGGWLRAGVPLAGEGTPEVAEDAVAELAACLGLSTSAGTFLIGEALELRHRLPRVWALLMAGRVRPGRARQMAGSTIALSPAAVRFVDDMIAAVAGRVGPRQLERLILEAVMRHDPDDPAHVRLRGEHDPRGVWIEHRADGRGLSQLSGLLDTPDAIAVDRLLDREAAGLAQDPALEELSEQSRRALALGDLARRQPALSEEPPRTATVDQGRRPERTYTVVIHLSDQALTTRHAVGRLAQTHTPVSAERIREWLGDPTARVRVQPVMDLAAPVHVDAYEIPDRLRQQIEYGRLNCVFPHCGTPTVRCDLDHITPHADGGPTRSDNLAPLCRTHHRLKTHTGWRYERLVDSTGPPGATLRWTSPYGLTYDRDTTGLSCAVDPP